MLEPRGRARLSGIALLGVLTAAPVAALERDALFDLSLEELMNMEVTTAARKPQRLVDTAAAVFVITRDDIRRLGIRSIPEALRLAPGLSVQQIDSSTWAVGARGFTGRFANKLLVLQDGRPLYTPTFSGVEWDVQTTLIEQIERIEVVRGPGAAVWGTNAVSGVINIITRGADEAPGAWVSAGSDLAGGQHVSARGARRLSASSAARAFLHVEDPRSQAAPVPGDSEDDWTLARLGLRADRTGEVRDGSLVLEAYSGRLGRNRVPGLALDQGGDDVSGGFALARGTHRHDDGSQTNAQVSIDLNRRRSFVYDEDRISINVEGRHQWTLGSHELIAGGLVRHIGTDLSGGEFSQMLDEDRIDRVASVFLQDEIVLVPDTLSVNLGVRLEANELSDDALEWMPSARVLWHPAPDHAIWAAITRAVRTPSVGESVLSVGRIPQTLPPNSIRNPLPVPAILSISSNPDFGSETVDAFEVGLRGRLGRRLGYDLTLFSMRYDDLRSITPVGLFCEPAGVSVAVDPSCLASASAARSELAFSNETEAVFRGVEVAVDWRLREDLLLRGVYSHTDDDVDVPAPVRQGEVTAPDDIGSLRLEWTPSAALDASLWVRYLGVSEAGADSDTWQANAHVDWRVSPSLQLSLTGRNLFHEKRLEATSELLDVVPTGISRMVYVQARLTF